MVRFVQSKDVAWNFLGDDVIAFNLSGEREFHNLNATAAAVFEALQVPCTSEDLARKLVEEFAVDMAQASTDVESLLGELKSKRLIVES